MISSTWQFLSQLKTIDSLEGHVYSVTEVLRCADKFANKARNCDQQLMLTQADGAADNV